MEIVWLDVVAWSALICTILQFLSGVLICIQIRTKGSTNDVSPVPFLAGIVSCSLWLKYGILQYDHTLITVNTIGLLLQIAYTIFYYWSTISKAVIHQQLFITSVILFPILTYLKFFVDDLADASNKAGLLACCAGVIFCASPLGGVFTVFKTKSTECLPFPLIFATFVVSLLWFFYGYLLDDPFIQVPNFLGSCIAGVQLMLFVMYPRQLEKNTHFSTKK